MATDIGPLTAKLTASAAGMAPGLKAAEDALKSTGAKLADEAAKSGEKVAKAMNIGDNLSKMISKDGTSNASLGILPKLEAELKNVPGLVSAAFKDVAGRVVENVAPGLIKLKDKFKTFLAETSLGTALRWTGNLAMFLGGTLPGLAKRGFAALRDVAGSTAAFMEKIYKDPARFISDGLIGGIATVASKIPVIGGLLALPFQAVQGTINFGLDTFKEGMQRIKDLGLGAAKTGLPTAQFQIFSAVAAEAGVDVEEAQRAVFKLQQKFAEAGTAAEGTRTAFDKFGLSGKELAADAAIDFNKAAEKLAMQIERLPSSALKAQAAFETMGKFGFKLLPVFTQGSAAFGRARENASKFGLGVTDADYASVKLAERAGKQIAMMKTGFTNQITVAVAPILAEIGEMIGKLPTGFGGLSKAIIDNLESATQAVAYFVDAWGDSEAFWDGMAAYSQKFFAAILDGIGKVAESLPSLADGFRPTLEAMAFLNPTLGDLKDKILVDLGGVKLTGGFAEKAAKLREEADAALAAHQEEHDFFAWVNGTETAQAKVEGFFNRVRERMEGLAKDAVKADPFLAMLPRIQALQDKVDGPIGKFQNEMAEILQIQKAIAAPAPAGGLFGWLTDLENANPADVLGLGKGKALGGLAELGAFQAFQPLLGNLQPAYQPAAAAAAGTREAYSAIAAFQAGDQRQSVEEQMKQLLEQAQQQREEQIRIGKELLEFLAKNPVDAFGI